MGMQTSMTPQQVSSEYEAGLRFNQGISLYDCVETNENFFIGKQWEGVQANGLPTPVFNFLKRVVLFSVANVSTDNLKLHAKPMACGISAASALPGGTGPTRQEAERLAQVLNDQFTAIFELNKMGSLIRQFARNAAVDGDGCLYAWWDPELETGQQSRGGIRVEVLRNTQVLFGNPNNRDVEAQPYIIIEKRVPLEEARRMGGDGILPDGKESDGARLDALGGGKVTVLTRLWRDGESGTIHGYQCTRTAELRREWDLGIRRYPLCWMSWDYVQDCYHGQAMITGLIPNQIFVNKLFAMCMISLMTLAYPKVIYDQTRIPRWSNRVGAAIGVNGSVEGVARIMDPASISPQISQFIELAVGYTQKFLGASDAALGDARPDNTSAIIALQRAAATPMELTRQSLLQAMEDMGRVFMEFMAVYYGTRYVEAPHPAAGSAEARSFGPRLTEVPQGGLGGAHIDGGRAIDNRPYGPFTGGAPVGAATGRPSPTGMGTSEKVVIPFDFSVLRRVPCSVELDVGASSYWSEIAAMQTLDNLLTQGKISTVEYLRRLPEGQITGREDLIEALERQGVGH